MEEGEVEGDSKGVKCGIQKELDISDRN